jgi:hypothetical protein
MPSRVVAVAADRLRHGVKHRRLPDMERSGRHVAVSPDRIGDRRDELLLLMGVLIMVVMPPMRTIELGLPVAAVGVVTLVAVRRLSDRPEPWRPPRWLMQLWLMAVLLVAATWVVGPWFVSEI